MEEEGQLQAAQHNSFTKYIEEAFSSAKNNVPGQFYASRYQLLAFALLGSLSNVYSGWNITVGSGLGTQMVSSVVFGLMFMAYYLSVSELTSTFPFAGGSYALARCTLGFFPGYLVGCLEAMLYVLVLGLFNAGIAGDIVMAFPSTEEYVIVFVVLIYLLQVAMCYSKRIFYWSVTVIAIVSFVINITYVVGALRYMSFYRWAYSSEPSSDDAVVYKSMNDDYENARSASGAATSLFVGSGWKFFRTIPASVGAYSGPEFVNFACDDTVHAKKDVPWAQMMGALVMFAFNIIVPILASSMAPGSMGVANELNPLVPGFSKIFGLTRRRSVLLMMPGVYGYCLCMSYALSKLIASMAESHLFPVYFAKRIKTTNMPMRAMLLGLLLSIISLISTIINGRRTATWPNIIAILLFTVDGTQLVGFVVLKIKLARFKPYFVSPLGLHGAYLSFAAFAPALLCCMAFRAMSQFSCLVIAVYLLLASGLYYCVGQHFQEFAQMERDVMLPVHAEIKTANGMTILAFYIIELVRITNFFFVYLSMFVCRVFVQQVRATR
jgi:ethanolamine permease